jgi:hypothetical protein
MRGEEGAHGSTPKHKIVLPKHKPSRGTRDAYIKCLLFDPDNFRKNYCLDCDHHKVDYICMKCRLDIIDDRVVDVYLRGHSIGQVKLEELGK